MLTTLGTDPDPGRRIRTRQGNAIRSTRKLRGLKVDELAESIGVSAGAIRHWETGRFSPKQAHQVAIARALDVPWVVLFGLDGEAA